MIPGRLSQGFVSIYGTPPIQQFILPNSSPLTFGTINQLPDAAESGYAIGQSVLFPFINQYVLIYGNVNYFVIPQSQIILIEDTPDIS